MDRIVSPSPTAGTRDRSADLTAAIRLVALGLATRVTISPIRDARRLVEVASEDAADHDTRLELIHDPSAAGDDVVGILVTRSGDAD